MFNEFSLAPFQARFANKTNQITVSHITGYKAKTCNYYIPSTNVIMYIIDMNYTRINKDIIDSYLKIINIMSIK